MALRRLSSPPLSLNRVILRHLSSSSSSFADDRTVLTVETSIPFSGHRCDPPARSVETTPKELMTFFHDMSLMRRMEISADSLYKSKLIRGFCHLYDGQEVVFVGMQSAITNRDAITTAYRDHCIYLGRSGTLVKAFAELMGRRTGCSKGKGYGGGEGWRAVEEMAKVDLRRRREGGVRELDFVRRDWLRKSELGVAVVAMVSERVRVRGCMDYFTASFLKILYHKLLSR